MPLLPVSIVIITHNRSALLLQSVKAALSQSVPVEVIVIDDSSTDDTSEKMQLEYPGVYYYKSPNNCGVSCVRNIGARKATSDIIVFLDDDTMIEDPNIIKDTLSDFNDPAVGAVAIPFINVLQDKTVRSVAPDTSESYLLHAFIGACFAFRRDVFLALNGFREAYFYMGEEGDICIRMLQAGFYVKAGTAKPAFHHQPPNRISYSADYYGRRNDLFFLFLNAPARYLLPFIIGTFINGIRYGIKVKRLSTMWKALLNGLKLMLKKDMKLLRHPVSAEVFFKYRYLKKNEPLPLSTFKHYQGQKKGFPKMSTVAE